MAALAVRHRARGLHRRRVRPGGAQRPHPRAGGVALPPDDRGHPGQRGRRPRAGSPRGPRGRAARRGTGPRRAARPARPSPQPRPRATPGAPATDGQGVARRPARFEVHLRDLRGRLLQPPRPRRGPGRRRDTRPVLQPPVHLRRLGPRQDPPPARHRELRDRELPPPQGALRHHRDVHERLRGLPADLDHPGLQAPVPGLRRPVDRRRPVHGAQRGPPGGVLPHLQRPQGRLQADRPHLGPAPQVDRDARGPAPQPLPLRAHHRDRPPRPRDPSGHPALQVAEREPGGPRRRPRVHRLAREGQHPGARGRAHPHLRLREAQQRAHLPRPGRAGPLGPRPGRRAAPDLAADDPRRRLRRATASPSRRSAARAGPGRSSPPARLRCTSPGS